MSNADADQSKSQMPDDEDDTDALLAELEAEAEDNTSPAYQQRLRELQNAVPNANSKGASGMPIRTIQQDTYINLKSDDETLRFTTEHEKAIVHFRHPDFSRCSVMDEHLDRIAQRHSAGRASTEELVFARVDVNNAPFVVEKLGVRVLPCVIGFAQGVAKGKVVGFEGICWDGKEKDIRVSKALEDMIFSWGLLKQKLLSDDDGTDSESDDGEDRNGVRGVKVKKSIRGSKKNPNDDDDDWD